MQREDEEQLFEHAPSFLQGLRIAYDFQYFRIARSMKNSSKVSCRMSPRKNEIEAASESQNA